MNVTVSHLTPGRLSAGLRALVRGQAGDGAWVRPAVVGILLGTAVLYLWSLSHNGYSNEYYAMAAQAGTRSWKAFFFGSLDAGNFITVDKPPASLWLMALSGRVFGLSPWSLLAPSALLGVATVGLVYASVRRAMGPVAGLAAGVVLALTPVAALMFRHDNPDALLTFLMVAAGWALLRSIWTGRTRWLLLSAAVLGLAFNTKFLQAYVALPALVLTYFLIGPGDIGRRTWRLLAAAGVLTVSSGWWMVIVDLVPASSRPYIGDSGNNTVWNLAVSSNGLSRILGGAAGGTLPPGVPTIGGAPDASNFGGPPGLGRLFNEQTGGEVSWLLPFAAVALLAGLWVHWRSPRTDPARAAYVLWGTWLATHFLVFSLQSGIFHPYYLVAMAPAVAALAGMGLVDLWRMRARSVWYGVAGGAALMVTAWWGDQLLTRTPGFAPGLGTAELMLGTIAAALLVAGTWPALGGRRLSSGLTLAALAAGLVAIQFGPAAYALDNVGKTLSPVTPASGPSPIAGQPVLGTGGLAEIAAEARAGGGAGLPIGDVGLAVPGGPASGQTGGGPAADPALVSYLVSHQGRATWLVAVISSRTAAPLQIKTGRSVMAMGGFGGEGDALTVDRLVALVRAGRLRYVYYGDGDPPVAFFGSSAISSVITWVIQHGTVVRHGGSGSGTLYDLSTSVR
jgi:4-amino-4-deoxy-L-arabinose transferase-like glycosyltransferase